MAEPGGCTRALAQVCCGLLMFAVLLCSALALHAQGSTDGAIAGRVLSSAGTSAGGAMVVVRSLETSLFQQTFAGSHGEFLLPRLPPGEYALTAEVAGARLNLPQAVAVSLGAVTEVEVRLGGSGFSQARGSSAASLEDDPDPGELTFRESGERALEAGANPAGDAESGAGEISFRGLAPAQNSARTDGVSARESFGAERIGGGVAEDLDSGTDLIGDRSSGPGSGARSVNDGGRRAGAEYTFAQAAVREFRVAGQGDAAAYGSALYGHGVGGVITEATRAGGTRLHGMAFYTLRQSAWAAANPFAIASTYTGGVVASGLVKPQDTRQQYGGRIGGPVPVWGNAPAFIVPRQLTGDGRPRLFYFYAFDGQRRAFPAVSSPGYPAFYQLTPTQTALLGNRGVTTAKIAAALTNLASLTGTVPRRADQTVNFVQLDLHRSPARLIAEYNRVRWSDPAGARSSAVVDRGRASLGSSYGSVDSTVVRWTQTLRSSLTHELRLQYGHELQYETPQTPLPQEPAIAPGGLAPEVSIGPDGLLFGTPASLGQRAYPDERRLEAAAVLAWTHGRQLVQLGADFSAIRDFTDSLTNQSGTFTYDSGASGGRAGGLVDWITDYTFGVNSYPSGGCPSITSATHDFCFRAFAQSFGQQSLTFATQEWAGFLQDDLRLLPSLTVHAGLRYEYQFLPLPQQPNPALDLVFGATGASSVYPEDRNDLGPRLGVEWSPLGPGHGTLRAGWGAYFGLLPGATLRAALLETALPSSVSSVRILPTTETLCPQHSTVGFGYPCAFLAAPSGVVAATTSAVVFDRRFRLPEVQQGTLALERSVPGGLTVGAAYVLNLDRQLPNSVDLNIAPSTVTRTFQLQGGTGAPGVRDGETFTVPLYTARVSPSFGPVTGLISNANATYHGLTLQALRSPAAHSGPIASLSFRVAFTWSKAIDFGQNPGAAPRASGQFDPFNVRYDKGLAALNFPQRFAGTLTWTPSLRAGWMADAPVRAALSGWSLAAIASEGSGRPYSFDIFGGTRLTGGRESINGSGGSVVLPTVGRNTLRLPDSANVDVRLARAFAIGDALRLRASAEAFNLLNHRNLSGIQQRAYLVGTAANGVTPLLFQDAATVAAEGLNVQPFGTYTASGTGDARERQVQLGLRLTF